MKTKTRRRMNERANESFSRWWQRFNLLLELGRNGVRRTEYHNNKIFYHGNIYIKCRLRNVIFPLSRVCDSAKPDRGREERCMDASTSLVTFDITSNGNGNVKFRIHKQICREALSVAPLDLLQQMRGERGCAHLAFLFFDFNPIFAVCSSHASLVRARSEVDDDNAAWFTR